MAKGDRRKSRANNLGQQWWRKLSLPRRGRKETLLSPDGLKNICADILEAWDVKVKKRTARLRKAIEAPRAARCKQLATAEWCAERRMARVTTVRGNSMQSMGVFEDGVQWLFPEEALYLADRAQLDVIVDGLPASLQRMWGCALEPNTGVSLEEYCAYAHLRRIGYVVRRPDLDVYPSAQTENVPMVDDDANASNFVNPPSSSVVLSSAKTLADNATSPLLHAGVELKPLSPAFSVWRVGAYKRRGTHRPLFNLAVWRYEDSPPHPAQLTALLQSCTGKTRLRAALIDRGVVVLVDIANNATPLSSRYLNRLPNAQSTATTRPTDQDAQKPSTPQTLAPAAKSDALGSVDCISRSIRPISKSHFERAAGEASGAVRKDWTSESNVRSCCVDIAADVVESFRPARNRVEFREIADGIASRRRLQGEAVCSDDDIRMALCRLADNDAIVLSSDALPTVYLVHPSAVCTKP